METSDGGKEILASCSPGSCAARGTPESEGKEVML